jgi:hypothetical protein
MLFRTTFVTLAILLGSVAAAPLSGTHSMCFFSAQTLTATVTPRSAVEVHVAEECEKVKGLSTLAIAFFFIVP